MKTNELTGAALDWAVAKCEGWLETRSCYVFNHQVWDATIPGEDSILYSPSINWAQGGPIIERERLDIYGYDGENWCANDNLRATQYGPTPLVAAMRCYVASKLGDTVELPEGLE